MDGGVGVRKGRRALGGTAEVSGRALKAKLQSQDFTCPISGLKLTPGTAALDHRIPVALGGTHDLENLWIVHKEVNRMKGMLPLHEFVSWCERVAAHLGRGAEREIRASNAVESREKQPGSAPPASPATSAESATSPPSSAVAA